MILLIAEEHSPRLEYITGIYFDTLLGLEYRLIRPMQLEAAREQFPEAAILCYGSLLQADCISIPSESLLFENNVRQQDLRIETSAFAKLYFSTKQVKAGYDIDFDLFSAGFYLITDYESYTNEAFDEHDRHDEKANRLFAANYHIQPLLNIYAEHLWDKLAARWPGLQRKRKKFDYSITFDIDSPFYFRHKALHVQLGSMLKDLSKRRFQPLAKKFSILFGAQDPYDVYKYIFDTAAADKLLFFFLISGKTKFDTRYTHTNTAYRQLIRRIAGKAIQIGLHPSYKAYTKEKRIASEKERLERMADIPIRKARMHYLKVRMPLTYRYLLQAGITEDYSACPVHEAGFKHFIAEGFYWYDLESDTTTRLWIQPTMVMDRSLETYKKMKPEQAFAHTRELVDLTARFNGTFTLLLHNNTLSEWEEWKGWRFFYEKTLRYLQEKTSSR